MIRVGIIGCGYVTRMSHVPAAPHVPQLKVTALADLDLARARDVAAEAGVERVFADYRQMLPEVDAVIVALPHQLHAPVSLECLRAGKHVLCEKPMAMSAAECDAMLVAAEQARCVLAVGHARRFLPAAQLMAQAVRNHWLGRPVRFEAEEAVPFERFPAGAFAVRPPAGGALWDTGPHALDLLDWWFPGLTVASCHTDARGGVEANAEASFTADGGLTGTLLCSRTRQLDNAIRVYFEQGAIVFPTVAQTGLQIVANALDRGRAVAQIEGADASPFVAQLRNFSAAIEGRCPLRVDGQMGRRAVQLIEQCLAARQPMLVLPWEDVSLIAAGLAGA